MFPTYAYDTSKTALHALSQKLACDLAERHITVNAIAPGLFPSKMSQQFKAYAPADVFVSNIPLGRSGTLPDLAGVVIWLSSKAGNFVTGAVIAVDGGSNVNVKPQASL